MNTTWWSFDIVYECVITFKAKLTVLPVIAHRNAHLLTRKISHDATCGQGKYIIAAVNNVTAACLADCGSHSWVGHSQARLTCWSSRGQTMPALKLRFFSFFSIFTSWDPIVISGSWMLGNDHAHIMFKTETDGIQYTIACKWWHRWLELSVQEFQKAESYCQHPQSLIHFEMTYQTHVFSNVSFTMRKALSPLINLTCRITRLQTCFRWGSKVCNFLFCNASLRSREYTVHVPLTQKTEVKNERNYEQIDELIIFVNSVVNWLFMSIALR